MSEYVLTLLLPLSPTPGHSLLSLLPQADVSLARTNFQTPSIVGILPQQ
jgi:hypothetical protein